VNVKFSIQLSNIYGLNNCCSINLITIVGGLIFPPNTFRVTESRRMECPVYVARTGKMKAMYKILVGLTQGNRSLGRVRRLWKIALLHSSDFRQFKGGGMLNHLI
jgi:hypothetical protein